MLDTDAPDPRPAPGEALVRCARVGVSRADVQIAQGKLPFRGILGHEFVGVVESVNPAPGREAPHGAWVGKRVVGAPQVACGRCERCRAGLSQHCPARAVLGVLGRDGCFADKVALPVANLVECPKAVDDDAAVMAGAVAHVLHASRMIRLEGKTYITVLGEGVRALLAAQVMGRLNASVRLLCSRPRTLALAEKLGLRHRPLEDAGQRFDQDVVVECDGGDARRLRLALRFVRPRGTVILCGTSAPLPPSDSDLMGSGAPAGAAALAHEDMALVVNQELTIIGARCGRLSEGVEALARKDVDVATLITMRAALNDAPRAIAAAGGVPPGQPATAPGEAQLKVVMAV